MIKLSYEQKEELGLKYVFDMLEPVCPYGIKRLKEEGFYDSKRQAELERELENTALVLDALQSDLRAVSDLRHELSALKEISGSLKTGESSYLSEIDFFELTGFCLRIKSLIPLFKHMPNAEKLSGEGKHLNAQDERALNDAKVRMNNEIALALDIQPDRVVELIHEKTGMIDFA